MKKILLALILTTFILSTPAHAVDILAKRVKVEDTGSHLTSTNVEDALAELYGYLGGQTIQDEAFSSANFNGDTSHGVSQDDFYDYVHIGDTDDDGLINKIDTASNGFVKTTGSDGTLSIDTNTYLTGNQSIVFSGNVTGTGTTAVTLTIGNLQVTNAMLAGSIAASKLVGSDIATVGTITSGVWNGTEVPLANGGTGLTSAADDTTIVSTGAAWQAKAIPDCDDSIGQHLNYDTATNSFSCGTTGSGSGAPTDATYITQTAHGSLSAEQALSALSTGIMKVTTTTGVISSITDSAGIAGAISDESGSGVVLFGTSPTIGTPILTLGTTSSTSDARIYWDTTNKNIIVGDGTNSIVMAAKTKVVFSFSILAPTTASDSIMKQLPRAVTITKVTMKCTGGTNVVGRLYEVDGDGDQADQVGVETSDWTVTTTETEDTAFNNATFDAGDYIAWDTTSVSGSVTAFNVTVEGYET